MASAVRFRPGHDISQQLQRPPDLDMIWILSQFGLKKSELGPRCLAQATALDLCSRGSATQFACRFGFRFKHNLAKNCAPARRRTALDYSVEEIYRQLENGPAAQILNATLPHSIVR